MYINSLPAFLAGVLSYAMECGNSLGDDGSNGILRIAILGLCLVASAFFSAAETSLLTLSKIRVKSLADEGVRNAKILMSLVNDTNKVLSATLLGNNLSSILASAITTSLVIQLVGGNTGFALGVATGLVTLFILIFCDITPKSLAVRNAERIATIIAKPIYAVMILLTPLTFVLNKISNVFVSILSAKSSEAPLTYTENELKTIVDVSHEEGVLNVDEKEMLHNVFKFGDGEIREIMTPRIHVFTFDIDSSYADVKALYEKSSFSRFPVIKPGTYEIAGVLNIKDIAFITDRDETSFAITEYLRPAHFVYEFNNIAKVFGEMRKERISMSVVLDEYGIMVGIVTTEDFMEEIVGDINDEYDDEDAPAEEVGENEYIVDGTMGFVDFCDTVGVDIDSDDFDSIGGFVLGKLEDVPAVGDAVRHENVEFTVESVANNRIERLRVKLWDAAPDGEDGAAGVGAGAGAGASDADMGGDDNENDKIDADSANKTQTG